MPKVGIVGPASSVERILTVAKQLVQDIEFVPFTYEENNEIAGIIDENHFQVKGWLFSGPIPFWLAKEHLGTEENLVYCHVTGNEIYKCLIEMAYSQQKILLKASVDSPGIGISELEDALGELRIPIQGIIVQKYEIPFDMQELVQFHLKLWQEGTTDGAITTLQSVYTALQEHKVPVCRLTVTTLAIRQAISDIIEKMKGLYFKSSQVGLEIIEISDFDKVIEKAGNFYQLQFIELKIKEKLLSFCKAVDGYLSEQGNGRYEIFSSRGKIESGIAMIQDTIEEIGLDLDSHVVVGIGLGETVFSARINANRAASYVKSTLKQGIVIIKEDGSIIESVGRKEEVEYAYYSNDRALLDKLNEANIGIKTYRKVEAMIRRMKWDCFTTTQLADQLSVTDRNVRRIVASLCKAGLIECIGEESSSNRGRPSRKYRLV
ncbi:hypothetical protein [Sporomusa sp. KB1]|jgi:hypothetical protein|uniref:hypothetical protein n=1 Tax=Sporomusa sp. KB1 TaxID=943346 RepID=UPI00119D7944|nr:hypothetical protein [Sporomusa sp. KB1]TWH47276.1 hypothetical protein Salpa_3325 [Sporomusa sp. KB1]